jgi:hypothetical protein
VHLARFTINWGAYRGLVISNGVNADFFLSEKPSFYVAFAARAGIFWGKEQRGNQKCQTMIAA